MKSRVINIRIPMELAEELDKWRSEQIVVPTRSATIEVALRRMLEQLKKGKKQ